jgi:hypothetical protein
MYRSGDRVILAGHWEFEDGIVGTVTDHPSSVRQETGADGWEGCRRVIRGRRGPIVTYWVVFDEPHDDGSGDGPYRAAEIDEDALKRLDEGSST